MIEPAHSAKIAPGANGVFKPMIVIGGQISGTWARTLRGTQLTVSLHPFAAGERVAEQVEPEVARYRRFLGLPSADVGVSG
jgi:hypothetical protein